MISKSLSTSQRYARLNIEAGELAEFCQVMYPLLVAHADDYGRLAGDTFTVKHAIVPTSPRIEADVARALESLHRVGLIVWYEVGRRKYIQIQDFDDHQQGLHKRTAAKFPEFPAQGKGTEGNLTKQNRREGKGIEPRTAPPSTGARKGLEPTSEPLPTLTLLPEQGAPVSSAESFVTLWNQTVSSPIPHCHGMSDFRRRKIQIRLQERPIDDWLGIFQRIEASAFCRGHNDRGWVMSLDWLIKNDEHALRVLEGKYDDRRRTTGPEEGEPVHHMSCPHQPKCGSAWECQELKSRTAAV